MNRHKHFIHRLDQLTARVATFLLIGATIVFYAPSLPNWTKTFNILFQIAFISHTIFSLYIYGFPPFRRTVKSLQIYSGFGIFITVVLNIVFNQQVLLASILFWLNWFFVFIHISLAVYCQSTKSGRFKL